ncbi:MAG TPA: hypothetical protein VK914_06505 [bacterium]|nr:hypothetical protein [bacterium]
MKTLNLKAREATPGLMRALEKEGLILWLAPGRHALKPPRGSSADKRIYSSDPSWGPHMLISVTCNRPDFPKFGSHPDNEDFLMLGEGVTRPLYLVIARLKKDALRKKIEKGTLGSRDFIALKIKFNDPATSFFTLLKDVPHGEAAAAGPGRAPSFYVTESRDLPLEKTDFRDYGLAVQ